MVPKAPNPVLVVAGVVPKAPKFVLVVAGVEPNVPKPVFVVAGALPKPPNELGAVDVEGEPNEKAGEPNAAGKLHNKTIRMKKKT